MQLNSEISKDNKQRPLLIVSVYLPTKGCHDLEEYIDSIDQLFEIYQKYNLTHDILIGGDINEDLTKKSIMTIEQTTLNS